jgi:hypothetical protein
MRTGSSTAIVPVHGSSPRRTTIFPAKFGQVLCICPGGRLAKAGIRLLRLRLLCIAQFGRNFGTGA